MNQEEITKAFRNFWIDDCWNHASLHHQMQSYCHLRSWHTSSLDSHHHGLWTCTLDLLNHLAMGALVWHTTWAFSVSRKEGWMCLVSFFLSIDRIKKVFELHYQWLRFYKKQLRDALLDAAMRFFFSSFACASNSLASRLAFSSGVSSFFSLSLAFFSFFPFFPFTGVDSDELGFFPFFPFAFFLFVVFFFFFVFFS